MTAADVKECPVPLSLEQITEELMTDPRPGGADGCSNVDRIGFIMEVMGCSTIDLNATYDFTAVPQCKDISMVEATKHLALLQLEYINRAYYHHHMDIDQLNIHSSHLILAIQRMNWHLEHLGMDRPTPPFPFIH